jgi:large subunit ribosomal protein L17
MRHLKSGRHLSRNATHRKALLNNLAGSLIQYEMIQTTDAKAKELRRVAERLITLGKRGTLHARRQAIAQIGDVGLVAKLFDDLAKREEIAGREGGYTRIIKVGNRQGDNAPISRISFVGATLESTEALRYPAHIRERIVSDDDGEENED